MTTYKIADIFFSISSDVYLPPCWDAFRQSDPEDGSGETAFSVIADVKCPMIHGVTHISALVPGTVFMEADGSVLSVSEDFIRAQLILPGSVYGREELFCHLFYTHAVRRGILQVHSSLVNWKGRGILFIGPSGIGKTTQAELWEKYRHAEIINGDMLFLQKRAGRFYGVGSPWHGSSPYCLNKAVEIAAIVSLKQDTENKIRLLRGFEKVSVLADSLFYPLWSETGAEACVELLDGLVKSLRVYQLSCCPDRDAVELLEKTVSEEIRGGSG